MNTQKPHNLEKILLHLSQVEIEPISQEEMLIHLSQMEIEPISQEEIIQKILETSSF